MNYINIDPCEVVNGHGIGVTLSVAGCTLNCKGCFNKFAQDFKAGSLYTPEVQDELFEAVSRDYISRLTILGGEPFVAKNWLSVLQIALDFRKLFGNSKTLWLYSGFTLEEILDRDMEDLLQCADVLVDGRFVEELKDKTLAYRGSKNQRLLYRGVDF